LATSIGSFFAANNRNNLAGIKVTALCPAKIKFLGHFLVFDGHNRTSLTLGLTHGLSVHCLYEQGAGPQLRGQGANAPLTAILPPQKIF